MRCVAARSGDGAMSISRLTNNWQYFAHGIWVTVRVTTSACVLGFCIAFCHPLMRTSALLPLRIAAGAYWKCCVTSLHHSALHLLLRTAFCGIAYRAIAGTIALAMFVSAYYAQCRRGAMALSARSGRSGTADGLHPPAILRDIIIPQMWKFAQPPMAARQPWL